jgi:hypothetical protein
MLLLLEAPDWTFGRRRDNSTFHAAIDAARKGQVPEPWP